MSDIRANTISDASGNGPINLHKQSAAKAWVNFNGTGTVAVRDSLNLSSLTDLGVGAYELSYTNSFSNAGYSVSGVASGGLTDIGGGFTTTLTGRRCYEDDGTLIDPTYYCHSVNGDLA